MKTITSTLYIIISVPSFFLVFSFTLAATGKNTVGKNERGERRETRNERGGAALFSTLLQNLGSLCETCDYVNR